jgi:hypothetical protein
MAALTYTVLQQDVDRYGTLASITENTGTIVSKMLLSALDPLVDYQIVRPADAYEVG